jgi:hypothetical protein
MLGFCVYGSSRVFSASEVSHHGSRLAYGALVRPCAPAALTRTPCNGVRGDVLHRAQYAGNHKIRHLQLGQMAGPGQGRQRDTQALRQAPPAIQRDPRIVFAP